MDTVTLDGKVYLKATKAAALVGYTPDYVGQLCRKGTLDGLMLGKTWYVGEESLLSHKNSQQRMNTVATRRDIQKQQNEQQNTLNRVQHAHPGLTTPTSAGYRSLVPETNIHYSQDSSDLLPSVVAEVPVWITSSIPVDASVIKETEESTDIGDSATGLRADEIYIDKDEMEDDYDIGAAHDSQKENSIEIPISIHKIAPVSDMKGSPALTRRHMRDIRMQMIAKKARTGEDTQSTEGSKVEEGMVPSNTVVVSRSFLPVVCLLLLLFVAANVVLESSWSYVSKQVFLETTYNFASVTSILEITRDSSF